jgi:hypothetical protein
MNFACCLKTDLCNFKAFYYKGDKSCHISYLFSIELLTFTLWFCFREGSLIADFDIDTSKYLTVSDLETFLSELQNMTSKDGYMNITVFDLSGDTPTPTTQTPTSVISSSATPTSSMVSMTSSITVSSSTSASFTASDSGNYIPMTLNKQTISFFWVTQF